MEKSKSIVWRTLLVLFIAFIWGGANRVLMLLRRHGQSMTIQSSLSPFIMVRRASWAMESMK